MIEFDDIVAANRRIASHLYLSPCPPSIPLSDLTGIEIFCKLDYLQRTGSFKERGACNALLQLSPELRLRGVVAASAGNHALGLAYHGGRLGIPVHVVMPRTAPLVKISTCRKMGAQVELVGTSFAEAFAHAKLISERSGPAYVHGFDDPAIICGQGTMALEVLDQVAGLDAVVIPIGGGGLIAGMSVVLKQMAPGVEVIGVEPERAASFSAAMEAGEPVEISPTPTLADGLAVARVGSLAFDLARPRIDRLVRVSEAGIALAILRLLELEKGVVEGSAAATLAACMSPELADLRGHRVAIMLCGGNIDPNILSRVIDRGLVADGRLIRFTAHISDRPGGLAALAGAIASAEACIREVTHDRAFAGVNVSAVNVHCVVETRDREHIIELREKLETARIPFTLHAEAGFEPDDLPAG